MTQVPPSTPPDPWSRPDDSSGTGSATMCYRHPKREANVRCARCNRPICPDCMTEASVGHQCPECVSEGRRTQRATRTVFGGTTAGQHGYVTKTLIGINVLVLGISALTAGGRGLAGGGLGGFLGNPTPATAWGAVVGIAQYGPRGALVDYRTGVADGDYYRLLTSMFLHYGLIHLALNMWALWLIGRDLESALGPVRFLALYLVAGLGGSVACYLFSPTAAAAGASGAIYGLFAALFVIYRRLKLSTAAIIPVIVINLIFSFSVPNISVTAHLGGLVTGGLVATALAYAPAKRRNLIAVLAIGGLLLVMVLAVVGQTAALSDLPLDPARIG